MNSASTRFKTLLQGSALSLFTAGLFAMCSLSATAHAATVIADGGFESAGAGGLYFSGSSIDGGSWKVNNGAVYIDTQDPYVYGGNNSVNLTLANLYVPNSLDQILSTTVGQQYTVSFWGDADSSNKFSLTENGIVLSGSPTSIVNNGFPDPNNNSSQFVDYVSRFVATSASTDLSFTDSASPAINSPNGSVMIDDIKIAATPEPGSIVLMLTGVIALGMIAGRKRLVRSVFAT